MNRNRIILGVGAGVVLVAACAWWWKHAQAATTNTNAAKPDPINSRNPFFGLGPNALDGALG